MFGWRKRNDGFEWREYVRTTILLRRKNRRERVGQAGRAAVEGLKAAGEHGVAVGAQGAQVLGRGAKAAGRQGFAMGVAGVRAADDKLRAGLPVAGAALGALGRRIGAGLRRLAAGLRAGALRLAEVLAPVLAAGWRGIAPALAKLRKPGVAAVLAIIAAVALIGSVRRIAANGLNGDILIALLIGTVITCALLTAWLSEGVPQWLATPLRGGARSAARLAGALRKVGPGSATVLRGLSMVAVLAVAAAGGWLVWRAAAAVPALLGLTEQAATIKGRAIALSGDTLRVASTTITLSGIEAPLDGQTCRTRRSRRRRCDRAAKVALAHMVRRRRVTCELSGSDETVRRLGTCRIGEMDIAAELVRRGHVFAKTGLFAAYGALENEARDKHAGLWRGEPLRPADYRAQKWEEAKRAAPDGCPIKGDVKRGRRVYVLPWSRGYRRVRVSRARGERWFCSEDEARAAGFKPSDRS